MIDYKEYARQMRENYIVENGILQVTEELWLAIADVIERKHPEDVVEVVRCKDCKHSKYKPIVGRLEEGEQTALLYCTMFVNGQHIYEDDFCSYGERKA